MMTLIEEKLAYRFEWCGIWTFENMRTLDMSGKVCFISTQSKRMYIVKSAEGLLTLVSVVWQGQRWAKVETLNTVLEHYKIYEVGTAQDLENLLKISMFMQFPSSVGGYHDQVLSYSKLYDMLVNCPVIEDLNFMLYKIYLTEEKLPEGCEGIYGITCEEGTLYAPYVLTEENKEVIVPDLIYLRTDYNALDWLRKVLREPKELLQRLTNRIVSKFERFVDRIV